jgi:hypothetical protein
MAKITVQFDEVKIQPAGYDEEEGQIVDVIYKLNGEEVHWVEKQPLGKFGLDIKMKVDFEITQPVGFPAKNISEKR